MTSAQARKLARQGKRVRRRAWPVHRVFYYSAGGGTLRAVGRIDNAGVPATVRASDIGREDIEADDWELSAQVPLATRTLVSLFDPSLNSFGNWPAGFYRMVYEQGALYYVAGAKNQLRVNAFATSSANDPSRIGNGWRITRYPGVVDRSLDHRAPGDDFQYAVDDPRTEAELLADIALRNRGAETAFEHPGGEIFMYLGDDYTNNSFAAQSPQFTLYAV